MEQGLTPEYPGVPSFTSFPGSWRSHVTSFQMHAWSLSRSKGQCVQLYQMPLLHQIKEELNITAFSNREAIADYDKNIFFLWKYIRSITDTTIQSTGHHCTSEYRIQLYVSQSMNDRVREPGSFPLNVCYFSLILQRPSWLFLLYTHKYISHSHKVNYCITFLLSSNNATYLHLCMVLQ